jgi:tetratricopeptide (TPR) repeat protein
MAYSLSFNSHRKHMVDLEQATPVQKQRYRRMMRDYCTRNLIMDFSFLTDETLRHECLEAQLDTIRKHLATEADKAPLNYYMGWLCFQNHMVDKGIPYLLEVLRSIPTDQETNTLLKKAFLQTGRPDIWISNLEEKIAGEPENPAWQYHLAMLLFREKKISESISYLKAALAIQPDFSPALNQLALIYSMTGDMAQALQHYKRLVQARPELAGAYYNIACIYARQNNVPEALAWLRSAVDKGYDNRELIKTDKDLDNIRETPAYRDILSELSE